MTDHDTKREQPDDSAMGLLIEWAARRTADVDPLPIAALIKSAASDLRTVLDDPSNSWSGDYAMLLAALAPAIDDLGKIADHVHGSTIQMADDLNSDAWSAASEQAGEAGDELAAVAERFAKAAGLAQTGQAEFANG